MLDIMYANVESSKPPVILYYSSFQGNASVVVPFDLCFGDEILCCLNLVHVFLFYVSSGNWVAAYWEIDAHSAYDMFSKHKYPIANLVFPTSVFGVGIPF